MSEGELKLCRYSQHCPHFQDSSYTCWHEDEAVTYCGIFKRIKKEGG